MSDLKKIHDELVDALDQLTALTGRARPDEAVLGALRYRLSRTSGARRKLVQSLCAELEPLATPETAAKLRSLRATDRALFTQSTAHVGGWGLRDVMKDWGGYCVASRDMRRAMFAQIEAEKRVLYPLLARAP